MSLSTTQSSAEHLSIRLQITQERQAWQVEAGEKTSLTQWENAPCATLAFVVNCQNASLRDRPEINFRVS